MPVEALAESQVVNTGNSQHLTENKQAQKQPASFSVLCQLSSPFMYLYALLWICMSLCIYMYLCTSSTLMQLCVVLCSSLYFMNVFFVFVFIIDLFLLLYQYMYCLSFVYSILLLLVFLKISFHVVWYTHVSCFCEY